MPSVFTSRFLSWILILACLAVLAVEGRARISRNAEAASTQIPVTGWAWSAGTDRASGDARPFMGWISFSSTNADAGEGSSYGVFKDASNGDLSGHAWSSNLGWISFNAADVSGCPSSPCAPKVNPGNGKVTGWARACSAFANKNVCSGALDANSGGWDGWISLSGSNYGITEGGDGVWAGYAWGSDAIGWISVSGGTGVTAYAVTSSNPRTVVLTADDFIIDSGASTILRWTPFTGATSCNFTPATNPLYRPGGYNPQAVTSVSTGPLTANENYVVTCTDASGSPENSNPITVEVRIPIVSISANPSRLASGAKTTVSWNASNAASCEITRNNTHWKSLPAEALFSDSLEDPIGITSQTTYRITCSGVTATATVNINPAFQEF